MYVNTEMSDLPIKAKRPWKLQPCNIAMNFLFPPGLDADLFCISAIIGNFSAISGSWIMPNIDFKVSSSPGQVPVQSTIPDPTHLNLKSSVQFMLPIHWHVCPRRSASMPSVPFPKKRKIPWKYALNHEKRKIEFLPSNFPESAIWRTKNGLSENGRDFKASNCFCFSSKLWPI